MKDNNLSLSHFFAQQTSSFFYKTLIKIADKLLGIDKLNYLYQCHDFNGLSPNEFTQKFIQVFDLDIKVLGYDLTQIPKDKAIIIVANHPFGGIEGVILTHVISQYRPDLKVLANRGLSIFKELSPYFIFTNPLKVGASGNLESIKSCKKHLDSNGALVLFPAGRVSYFRKDLGYITDHNWHRSLAYLAKNTGADILPLYITGKNRSRFYHLGKIYFRFRLLMLIREMLAAKGKAVPMTFANKTFKLPEATSSQAATDLVRLSTYLLNPEYQQAWTASLTDKIELALAPYICPNLLDAEIKNLNSNQKLASHKHFSVYYANYDQIPNLVEEIRIRREETFRLYKEGSGQPQDGDELDKVYTHLFVFDHDENAVVGAYRMGQTDLIQQNKACSGLYLSQMFDFGQKFINQTQACLEMGRSFILPKYQKSYYSLLLLFKGIAHFVNQKPEYQTLYGTVSLSTEYEKLSVYLIERFLVTDSKDVTPKQAFNYPPVPELDSYLNQYPKDIASLEWLIKQIEPDGKGLPVLLKQYYQLGAKFHCLGIDPNFAQTPGLLLSVHLPSAPERLLKLYLGSELPNYLTKVNKILAE
ncbi:lysophospholipid acyltransferase family protein [Catenovulum maritimum]|uniref:L-ornithine N(alpha)-acyltransferase n=1 Tax=Catenovulum maritimum TaxID=1513271 RepID=A0A0J8GRI1_9ALTE|nr:GNAT family N-acyltransferase [Catenovulum maritimum]KMT65312.1 hypothetical protein XM47_09770 [Catenovulum maritimum]